jgi:hypothetical protein
MTGPALPRMDPMTHDTDLPPIVAKRGAAGPPSAAADLVDVVEGLARETAHSHRLGSGRPMFVNRYGLPPLPEPMRAAGGWTAPITPGSMYDWWTREPWTSPHIPWSDAIDVDVWLFPRWSAFAARARDYRRRVTAFRRLRRMSWRTLRRPQHDDYDDPEGYGDD